MTPHLPMTLRNVIDGGFCIGCGACTAVVPRIRIDFNSLGDLVATLPADMSAEELTLGTAVCPFADGENETETARKLFAAPAAQWHKEVGMYVGTHAAFAPAHQARASSGGLVTWLLTHLLESGQIDFAVHVGPRPSGQSSRFFGFRVSASATEVAAGSTSFYYPVSMDDVLRIVREKPGRYAVTGVPCFHKALRRLRAIDSVINERICFQIGLVCGQMKSAHYLEYLSHRAGVQPGHLQEACFRRKLADRPANDYAFEAVVQLPDGMRQVASVMNSAVGVNWGMGYFKPKACEFCDDVMGETADIAAMDAWLPEFVKDGQGWSLVVTRTQYMEQEVQRAVHAGSLVLRPATAGQVAESQRGGLNHRRTALPFRLWLHRKSWHPRKRVQADSRLPWALRIEQHVREMLRTRSRSLWLTTGHTGAPSAFQSGMAWGESLYRWVVRLKHIASRFRQSAKRRIRSISLPEN